ncbi:MAG: hypothetical protein Q9157_008333 [Trypethelium eluteriae]
MKSFDSKLSKCLSRFKKDFKIKRSAQLSERFQLRSPTVQHILKHRDFRRAYMEGYTPLATLYRIYEYVVLDDVIAYRNEIEDFWDEGPKWPVAGIPDPQDPDPARYAILAVMTLFIHDAFNERIDVGIPRDAPPWVAPREGKPLPIGQPPPGVERLLAERKSWRGPYTDGNAPLPLLYRMYESFVADDELGLREDIRYFWGKEEWAVADIPDPHDPDPERYAILAAITGMLVLAFNYKIGLGFPRDGPAMIRGHAHILQLQAQPKK